MAGKKTGYRVQPQRVAKLVFEGEHAGAIVRLALDFSIGDYLEAQWMASISGDVLTAEQSERLGHFLAHVLVDWNLEDKEGPIPATYEGVLRLPSSFISQLCEELVKALQPSAPLGSPSPAGSKSAEG